MRRLNWLDYTAFTLLIIGGLNWGLVGLFGFNLVTAIFVAVPFISRVIFTLVGISALYSIYALSKIRPAAMVETTVEEERMRRVA